MKLQDKMIVSGNSDSRDDLKVLEEALSFSKTYIPEQGPLEYFVHHNTLHSFESHHFFDALYLAGSLYEAKTSKSLNWYITEYKKGRITDQDLNKSLNKHLDFSEEHSDFVKHLLFWDEKYFSDDKFELDKIKFIKAFKWNKQEAPESFKKLNSFWDYIDKTSTKEDLEETLSLKRTKFFSAYFDKGLAYWQMEDRESGILNCFLDFCFTLPIQGMSRQLRNLGHEVSQHNLNDPKNIIISILGELKVPSIYWGHFIFNTLYKVKGWSALVNTLVKNQLYNPINQNVDFLEYLIVNLCFELACFRVLKNKNQLLEFEFGLKNVYVDREKEFASYVYDHFERKTLDISKSRAIDENLGKDFFKQFNQEILFKIWHEAYEENILQQTISTIRDNAKKNKDALSDPSMQIFTCIDDREESVRRYFEEIDPKVQTFGYAGHYGLNILFKAKNQVHYRPLCPVSVIPQHYVWEESKVELLKQKDTLIGKIKHFYFHSSKLPIWGVILTILTGPISLLFFFLEIFFPSFASEQMNNFKSWGQNKDSFGLNYEASSDRPKKGYSILEMADVVQGMLETVGLKSHFANVIFICAHGSTSMNNPHRAAYDCGACGGGNGSPNARLFAIIANRVDVREELLKRGIEIPPETRFVGGFHNTCNDEFLIFDREEHDQGIILKIEKLLNKAARFDAKERVRRFEDVNLKIDDVHALKHVQDRALDLAQARSEYGHSTNAICVVGKRELTRGTFLDRRAFLVSYDHEKDSKNVLVSLLSSIVPVCAGINLEYYFSFVDREIFGSGVKQPHNVTSLMGVMNGYKSDLRLGLPWQMVEIHEPVRIFLVFETTTQKFMDSLNSASMGAKNLVFNEWVRVIVFTPENECFLIENQELVKMNPRDMKSGNTCKNSLEYIEGKRGILDFKLIG